MDAEETVELLEEIWPDEEVFAHASYASHTAELAQAFGNLLAQAARVPVDNPIHAVALEMLKRVADSVETKPKGSLKSISKGAD